jgi:hypothetical protein
LKRPLGTRGTSARRAVDGKREQLVSESVRIPHKIERYLLTL